MTAAAEMHIIVCKKCGHDGPYYIVEVTEDWVAIRCPTCDEEASLPVGMDEKR
jgi:predicted RNA-binding Zn-ribbon protein involved in translation (DUF1610 family)